MSVTTAPPPRRTVVALLVLTLVTGIVDAVSFLRLDQIFVANMTGNVVFLGLSVTPSSSVAAYAPAIAIAGFTLGALAGGVFAARAPAGAVPGHRTAAALAAEAVLLACTAAGTATGVLPLDGPGRHATVVVLAVALGLQNGTVHRTAIADLPTTVVTLSLAGLVSDSRFVGGPGARGPRRAGSLGAMLAGAAVGALLLRISATVALAVAATLVALAVTVFATTTGKRP